MQTRDAFTKKAEKYARYRWDYAPEAVQKIFDLSGNSARSVIADIGAGTGILARHFINQAARIYLLEPNAAMRLEAEKRLPLSDACQVLDGSAEHIPLPDHSVDLITVAQAIHWFDPQPARQEFLRILKPGGWLAVLRNSSQPDAISQELDKISTARYGVQEVHLAETAVKKVPVSFYFGGAVTQKFLFPFVCEQNWETFLGAILSASYMPDESHPQYPRFEQAARRIFETGCPSGKRIIQAETELIIGQPAVPPEDPGNTSTTYNIL